MLTALSPPVCVCVCVINQAEVSALPVYGVGHSMGSLLHMLICARYAVKVREGGGVQGVRGGEVTR